MVGGLIYFHSNMALKNCHRVNFFAVEKKATIWSFYAHLQQKKMQYNQPLFSVVHFNFMQSRQWDLWNIGLQEAAQETGNW